jgi:predicted RNase H-like HicB family nuclease
MKLMLSRKLKYYMRLQYPVCIVFSDDGVIGSLPDFPGCAVLADSVSAVHARLDDARRAWIRDRVVAGHEVPLPNSYANAPLDVSGRRVRESAFGVASASP